MELTPDKKRLSPGGALGLQDNTFNSLQNVVMGATKVGVSIEKARFENDATQVLGVTTEQLERTYNRFANDPNLSMDSLKGFRESSSAILQGALQASPGQNHKVITQKMQMFASEYETNLLKNIQIKSNERARTETYFSIEDLKSSFQGNIRNNQPELANQTLNLLTEKLRSLKLLGASDKEIKAIHQSIEVAQGTEIVRKLLINTNNDQEVNQILEELFTQDNKSYSPDAWEKILSESYKLGTRINKIRKSTKDISGFVENSGTDNRFINDKADKDTKDKGIEAIAFNIANQSEAPVESPFDAPAFMYAPKDLSNPENIQEQLTNETVKNEIEQKPRKQPTIAAYAMAAVKAGTNSPKFDGFLQSALHGAGGKTLMDAINAIGYIYEKNPQSAKLDNESRLLYRKMRTQLDLNGPNADIDAIAENVRKIVLNKSKAQIEEREAFFDGQIGHTEKKFTNGNKIFKSIFNVDADKSGSLRAYGDFLDILKTNFVLGNGDMNAAIEETKLEMSQTYGSDNFSPIFNGQRQVQYMPISKAFPIAVQSPYQNNYVVGRVVFTAENTPDNIPDSLKIKFPESYKQVKTATEDELYYTDFPATDSFIVEGGIDAETQGIRTPRVSSTEKSVYYNGNLLHADIQVEQGFNKGRLVLEIDEQYEQNNLGVPVWRGYIEVRPGELVPLIDPRPEANIYSNKFLIIGQPLNKVLPEFAKKQSEEYWNELVQNNLVAQGKQLYPIISPTPVINFLKRKSYIENPENKKKVEALLRKEGK